MPQITVAQAAATLRISTRRVRALIKAGRLKAQKVAGVWILSRAAIDRMIRDREKTR